MKISNNKDFHHKKHWKEQKLLLFMETCLSRHMKMDKNKERPYYKIGAGKNKLFLQELHQLKNS